MLLYALQPPSNREENIKTHFDNSQTITRIRDPKPFLHPNQIPITHQILPTYRMERPQQQSPLDLAPNQLRQPLPHLPTRLDCKRATDDILGPVLVVGEEVRDARG